MHYYLLRAPTSSNGPIVFTMKFTIFSCMTVWFATTTSAIPLDLSTYAKNSQLDQPSKVQKRGTDSCQVLEPVPLSPNVLCYYRSSTPQDPYVRIYFLPPPPLAASSASTYYDVPPPMSYPDSSYTQYPLWNKAYYFGGRGGNTCVLEQPLPLPNNVLCYVS